MNIDEFIRESIRRNEEEAKRLMQKKRQERISELVSKSGIGVKFRKRTFHNFVVDDWNRDAFFKAKNFVESFPNTRGLLFMGPVGTGKTHLAAAIANYLIEQLYTVLFGNITDIIALVKTSYREESELTELEIINTLTKDIDLLVIDDLGKEYPTENTAVLLYQIINRLYENEKPVVITTNMTSEELKKRYQDKGEAIVSRITEMCKPVKLVGDDWRLKGAQNP